MIVIVLIAIAIMIFVRLPQSVRDRILFVMLAIMFAVVLLTAVSIGHLTEWWKQWKRS